MAVRASENEQGSLARFGWAAGSVKKRKERKERKTIGAGSCTGARKEKKRGSIRSCTSQLV